MAYLIGIALAVVVGLFAGALGFDKERSFYPVVLIVIAALYVLFAAIAGSTSAMAAETLPALLFVAAAAVGFRKTLWIVVGGLAGHGVFDFFHHGIVSNPGVPAWWPAFCLAYDVTAAACLGVLIRVRGVPNAGP
jgi:hypothetical protein